MHNTLKALDLFAGTGWGVACQRLGIDEMGVELMPEAVATREANGMHTLYRDVWDGLQDPATLAAFYKWCADGGTPGEFYDLLIASPPCQTFSMAGHGSGRAALDEVIEAIELDAYKDPQALRDFGEKHDMRTALVLTPLAHVWRDRPRLVALEQVPTVLPVWHAYADVMREWGYSVAVEVMQAEQYGVPQTRKRAILLARLDGEAKIPAPTHSAYYPSNPSKLDPGVKKWVSMAEALGWTPEEADGSTYTGNNKLAHQAVRSLDQPAPTVTAGHDSGNRGFIDADGQFFKATVEQVSALQSYPTGWGYIDRPAMTVTGHGMLTRCPSGQKVPAAAALEAGRFIPRPPFTLETARKQDPRETPGSCYSLTDNYHPDAVNCTPAENAILQSYEPRFVWCGARTKQYLQIGNAVPPLLAQAILTELAKPATATVHEPDLLNLVDDFPVAA